MGHMVNPMTAQRHAFGAVRAWTMIGVLSILFVVSMVDRFALGLLVEPLKRDLGVSDVQLGFLFGSAFAIFYGIMTIPLARLADRGNRIRLIVFAVLLWSLCTIASGFATSFPMLILLRIGLAIGEAALVPATYSLIADALPAERRTLGGAVFNCFGMAGASAAYLIGAAAITIANSAQGTGYFADLRDWQAVFIIIGLPGIFLALVFAASAREPSREAVPVALEARSFSEVLRFMRSHGWLYPGLFIGAGCLVLGANGFLAWTPAYLSRAYGMSTIEGGQLFGMYNLLAFIAASLAVPLACMWGSRYRRDIIVIAGMACAILSTLSLVMAVLQPTHEYFLFYTFAGMFFAVGGASNTISSFHKLTPPHMRATLTSMLLIFLTTVALGLAPPLVGDLSNRFGTGNAALGVGLGLVSAFGGAISLLLFWAARKSVLRYLDASGDQSTVGAMPAKTAETNCRPCIPSEQQINA